MVKEKRITIYITALVLIIVSMIGVNRIQISGSLIEDMPQKTEFYKDILFFENEFNGIMPLEIMVDTKRKKGVNKLSNLKRIDELEEVAKMLHKGLQALGQYKYPLAIRKGVSIMADKPKFSKTVKAGAITYFFDVRETKKGV